MSRLFKKHPKPVPHVARPRLVPRGNDDKFDVKKTGGRNLRFGDGYVLFMSAPWRRLINLIVLVYLTTNIAFALAYLATGNGIENARPGSFADAFFFSVQTMSTIGYGKMCPVGLAANIIVVFEVLAGFIFFAVMTGLIFAKFSRPTARVLFSNVAVVCPYEGKPHLMLRLANERNNRIVDANIHMVVLKKETTKEGQTMRRFHDLTLLRSRIPLLQLSWTLMHPLDENSPLQGLTPEILEYWDAEIIVSFTGLDETFSQTIHARQSYIVGDIILDATFVDIINRHAVGNVIDVDYTHFHDVRPLKAS